jgi:H+/Cl- antiporter ClcA
MSTTQSSSAGQKKTETVKRFFDRYPATPYLLKWLLFCTIIGICAGTASAGFLYSLDWATEYRENNQWIIWLLPIGGLAIGLLYHYFGKDVEAGNNLLIDTIHEPRQTIPFKMAPFVYLGTMVTHLLGGSAGREGTALQMSGAIADQFSKPFRLNKEDRKILLIAAIAAGFGAVFGTPLAGAIFGMEVTKTGRIKYTAVFASFLAAIIANLVTNLWQAAHTHYHIATLPAVSALSILYAILAGIFFGICEAAFSKLMHKVSAFFKTTISYAPLRPFIAGIIIAVAVWAIGTTKYIGLGIPVIVQSFDVQLPPYDFVLKIAFTIITIAAGFKGGEVTPLFFIGAVLGNALSYFIPLPVGLLAGMGFVAVFAGATNTPLACTVMAIELFGIECGVYVAIACVVAYLFSGQNSIYKKQLAQESKPSLLSKEQNRKTNNL